MPEADPEAHRLAEQAVLRALLDSAYTPAHLERAQGTPEILLQDHFTPLDSVAAEYAGDWLRDSLAEVPKEAIAEFRRVATDTSGVVAFPLTRATLRLIADSTIDRIFTSRSGDLLGWTRFREAYPNGDGIVGVSRVGLSADRTWAVVYAGRQLDWRAGTGHLYVLHKDRGAWHIKRQRMVWAS